MGNPDISRAQAIAAAEVVNANIFIEALPEGYDTQLVERGQNLSQGQRQLLAFARVLAADPEIEVIGEFDVDGDLSPQDQFLRHATAGHAASGEVLVQAISFLFLDCAFHEIRRCLWDCSMGYRMVSESSRGRLVVGLDFDG